MGQPLSDEPAVMAAARFGGWYARTGQSLPPPQISPHAGAAASPAQSVPEQQQHWQPPHGDQQQSQQQPPSVPPRASQRQRISTPVAVTHPQQQQQQAGDQQPQQKSTLPPRPSPPRYEDVVPQHAPSRLNPNMLPPLVSVSAPAAANTGHRDHALAAVCSSPYGSVVSDFKAGDR